jgi:hypothetical protein
MQRWARFDFSPAALFSLKKEREFESKKRGCERQKEKSQEVDDLIFGVPAAASVVNAEEFYAGDIRHGAEKHSCLSPKTQNLPKHNIYVCSRPVG